jgi:hypothetical protein
MIVASDQLLNQVVDRGWIIANGDDPEVVALLKRRKNDLAARQIKIRLVGVAEGSGVALGKGVSVGIDVGVAVGFGVFVGIGIIPKCCKVLSVTTTVAEVPVAG